MKIIKYSIFLSTISISSASTFFGHLGLLGDLSLSKKDRANFGGITTHVGYEFDHRGVVFGIGAYAGAGIFGNSIKLTDSKISNNQVIQEMRETT